MPVRLSAILLVVLLLACGTAQSDEADRFDAALKDKLTPVPSHNEVIETCDAMAAVGWDFRVLYDERDRDRIVEIAAVVENARWEYVSSGNRTQLSWDRYFNTEEWPLYCSEKRQS